MTSPSFPRAIALLQHDRGVSIVEFALIVPVFLGMILGFMDFGYWTFVRATTLGGLEEAARSAGVGGPAADPAVFESKVQDTVRTIAANAKFTWDKKSYYEFSGIGKPEKLTSDINGNGMYDKGDCWEDLNPNGTYDTNPGKNGIGGADDILVYRVVVAFEPLLPITGLLPGVPETRSVTASTIVKRQPYAAQTAPAIRC